MGAFAAKFKEIFTVGNEDEYDEMDTMEETEMEEKESAPSVGLRILSNTSNRQKASASISLAKVVVYEPVEYKDATNVIDSLKNNKIVIMKLENVKESRSMDAILVKQQIFECINGAVYALEGTIEKLSETIFLLAPKDVDVDATTLDTDDTATNFMSKFYN
ncbi:cell division protein SepF [Criibacterium bergeronii]|uniref:Cell division protein SepF n=1 Tax=Criibacterium bergeronii TaxID=1871336 RepID=A0A371IJ15_9FIRM|nr:cell division protein SepF [Criibacterium bergeronii]MBS6063734.1 cell division protein SepF [Peptostreptococcaceae bacterium]RDY20472.1 cell division protein SepF [Criibacterium bergeronii]TRW28309.1 cell division protein SepF [Criibacterium bergeronii]